MNAKPRLGPLKETGHLCLFPFPSVWEVEVLARAGAPTWGDQHVKDGGPLGRSCPARPAPPFGAFHTGVNVLLDTASWGISWF